MQTIILIIPRCRQYLGAKQELQLKVKMIAAKARKSGREAEREDPPSKSRKNEVEKRDRQKEDLVSNEKTGKSKNKATLQASNS